MTGVIEALASNAAACILSYFSKKSKKQIIIIKKKADIAKFANHKAADGCVARSAEGHQCWGQLG